MNTQSLHASYEKCKRLLKLYPKDACLSTADLIGQAPPHNYATVRKQTLSQKTK